MASNYIVNVPRLKGRENYADWSFAVENFLILEGLSKCLKEVVEAEDAKAKAKLILTIDTSLYIHIRDATTTVDLWNKLKSLFDDNGFARKISLLRSLISCRLENCDSMASYVNHIVETSQKLRGTGFKIDEEWIGSLLLAGLPEKFSPMIMAIEHSGIAITSDGIKTKLLDMEVDIGTSGSAFASKSNSRGKPSAPKSNTAMKNVRCFKCKQRGHYQNKCTANLEGKNKENNQHNAFSAVFLSGSFSKLDWYVDSGASAHLTANRDWMDDISNCTGVQEITVANKTKIPVVCSGNVDITTVVGRNHHEVTVHDVLYVPDLTTNLLSVSQLIQMGNTVEFELNCCKIFNSRHELIATADLKDGVYKLNILRSGKCLLAPSNTVSGEIWHRRFGHINSDYLNKMKKGAVSGLNYPGTVDVSLQNCEVCCEGKQHRLPFKHRGTNARELLEIVHTDVCGPMENRSLGGAKYFVTFEDGFSKMAFVYFIKSKDEVFNCFKSFKSMTENQTNHKIKTLRSDNGGEYCSKEFKLFLEKSGIVHQKSNPYTPEQNGISERLNRTIVEKAKCLLYDTDLKKSFWAEAVNTAVYLRNRSLVAGLQKTPFEVWTGSKPDVSHLRIFGSPVMVHVPKEKRVKWDKKSEKCIFLGYGDTVKGYRVYNPVRNNVFTSRDVIVMENIDKSCKVLLNGEANDDHCGDSEISVSVGDTEFETEASEQSTSSGEIYDEADSDDSQEAPVELRRSQRIPKPRYIDGGVSYLCLENSDVCTNPSTVEAALSSPDKELWEAAMQEELQSFEENKAWKLVDIPADCPVVKCKWVFKKKCDSVNNVRYRARLVAKGFTQRAGIDFDETFSPVVRHSTLRMLFALSVQLDLDVTHLDVTTAFLNGVLKENVYMEIPEGFVTSECKNKVLKLNKAIYGLKQASRAWNTKVDEFLVNMYYKKSQLEPCLYIKNNGDLKTIVALYVDDFFIFSNDKAETDVLKMNLGKEFKIKDMGQVKQCLGMRVNIDKVNHTVTLDQVDYVNQILKRFNMTDCKPVSTPIETKLSLGKSDKVCEMNVPYQELIGCLMYLAVLTRPDIAFSVSFLSQFNTCYDNSHWNQAKRILRYLQKTKNYGLKFCKNNVPLEGFADADWASDSNDRKSFSGFCFKLSGCVISWESRKQRTVALSSTEAEYMAISEASKEAIYFRNLLVELVGTEICVRIFNDNQSAQKLSVNPVFHKRSKHIDVRHHFIRDAIADSLVTLEYLQTADMPADILTKGLSSVKHCKFLNDLGIISLN